MYTTGLIQFALKNKSARDKPLRRLNIARLCTSIDILQERIQECLSYSDLTGESTGEEWTAFNESLYSAAADTLGFAERRYWFDEHDPEINKLINMLHKTHTYPLSDETCEKTQQAKQLVQQKLRQMKNDWWEKKAESLQATSDIT
ncbi:hypothetical protein ACOMHN_008870 [Nucella lapillus]